VLQAQDIINACTSEWATVGEIVDRVAPLDTQAPDTKAAALQAVQSDILRTKVQLVLQASALRGELERDNRRRFRKK
jgi:hypothetical protein